VTAEKGKAAEISYSNARSLVIFSGVSYYDNREGAVMFDYNTKEKEHQNTQQSDLYSVAMLPRTNQIALSIT
jgi:hypothetical protein